jgi:DNA-binding CsgD family transcriptional regulator
MAGVIEQERSVRDVLRADSWLLDAVLRPFANGSLTIVDHDLRYLYAAGTEDLDGAAIGLPRVRLTFDLLVGQRLDDLFPDEVVDRVRPFYARAFAGKTVMFTAPAFGREYDVRAWPITAPNGTIGAVVAVAQEVPTPSQVGEELTPRQREVVTLVAAGLTNKVIARRLSMRMPTVRSHIEQVMKRLGFATRTQVALWAFRHGLYRAEEDAG